MRVNPLRSSLKSPKNNSKNYNVTELKYKDMLDFTSLAKTITKNKTKTVTDIKLNGKNRTNDDSVQL